MARTVFVPWSLFERGESQLYISTNRSPDWAKLSNQDTHRTASINILKRLPTANFGFYTLKDKYIAFNLRLPQWPQMSSLHIPNH